MSVEVQGIKLRTFESSPLSKVVADKAGLSVPQRARSYTGREDPHTAAPPCAFRTCSYTQCQ